MSAAKEQVRKRNVKPLALALRRTSELNHVAVPRSARSLYDERMGQFATILRVRTRGRGLYEFTDEVVASVAAQNFETGLLTLFCRHTSASLLIQENAAHEVRDDLEAFFERIAPEAEELYRHDDEGPDDMPAHIRAALTQVSLSIPIVGGRLALGTWQGVYVFEHRRSPQVREVALHGIGA